MEYGAFLQAARRGEVPPVALVHGADLQLLDDALEAATQAVAGDADPAAGGRDLIDAREASVDFVVHSARTMPLFAATRLVAVRHAQALVEKGADALGAYVADPNPATRLLLLAHESLRGARDRGDHWLLRAVPSAAVVELPARRGRALEEWLRERAAAEGLVVREAAARLLVQWVGDDGAALLGEARKAALAGQPPYREVGVDEVTAVVGEQRVSGIFDLTRAIERRDLARALITVDRLLRTEEPMLLVAMLARELRSTSTIADWHRQGRSVEHMARILRRPPGAIEAALAAAAASPPARHLGRCWEVERRLKSGGEARAELTALVAELCGAS